MKDPLELVDECFDWDYQIATCDNLEEISRLEITKAISAFQFLKTELGIQYPKEVQKSKTSFCQYFWNKVPWTRVWFTWLAEAIKNLKQSENFDTVLKKLISKNEPDFQEAITLLEYGQKFIKSGFHVDFEKEVLNKNNKAKNPDICLTNPETQEIIFIEVTRLTSNVELESYSDICQRVRRYGFERGKQINYAGRLFKVISKERLTEIKKKVDSMAQSAVENDMFEEYKIEGVFEIAIASPKSIPTLAQWTDEHGYNIDSFALPPTDKFKRLRGKIVGKSNQSSPETPNLLIIKNDDFSSISKPETLFYELEETLFKCEDLLGTIIVSYEFGGREKEVQSFGMNTHITKTERHAISSKTGILINKYYKKNKITMHSLTRLVDAFDNN